MARLAKMGLKRDVGLVLHLPLRYEDETTLLPVSEAIARAAASGCRCRSRAWSPPARSPCARAGNWWSSSADDSGELVLRFLNFYGSQVS